MDITPYVNWIKENPEFVASVIVYLIVNLAPRKHPEQAQGWGKFLWWMLDRVSVLTHDKMPGKPKMIFKASPVPSATTVAATEADPDDK